MINQVTTSSKSDMWSTPQDFFDKLDAVYHFETDLAATPENAKCAKYYTKEQDALKQEWCGVCWLNPPYGRGLGKWMKKAKESAERNGATIVCLLPVRTNTAWWHDYCQQEEHWFLRGKLKFSGAEHPAPFANVVVVFKPKRDAELEDQGYILPEDRFRWSYLEEQQIDIFAAIRRANDAQERPV